MVIATVAPAARVVFERLDGQHFEDHRAFGAAFRTAVDDLGRMPRFWNGAEAIDWARRSGYVAINPDGSIDIKLDEAAA